MRLLSIKVGERIRLVVIFQCAAPPSRERSLQSWNCPLFAAAGNGVSRRKLGKLNCNTKNMGGGARSVGVNARLQLKFCLFRSIVPDYFVQCGSVRVELC